MLKLPDGGTMQMSFKGTVQSRNDLPKEGNEIGDLWATSHDSRPNIPGLDRRFKVAAHFRATAGHDDGCTVDGLEKLIKSGQSSQINTESGLPGPYPSAVRFPMRELSAYPSAVEARSRKFSTCCGIPPERKNCRQKYYLLVCCILPDLSSA
jgi:hypothetical protein